MQARHGAQLAVHRLVQARLGPIDLGKGFCEFRIPRMYKDVHCKPSKVGRSDHVPLEPFCRRPHYGSPRLVEQSELIRRAVIVQPVPPGRDAAAKAKRYGLVCRHLAEHKRAKGRRSGAA